MMGGRIKALWKRASKKPGEKIFVREKDPGVPKPGFKKKAREKRGSPPKPPGPAQHQGVSPEFPPF